MTDEEYEKMFDPKNKHTFVEEVRDKDTSIHTVTTVSHEETLNMDDRYVMRLQNQLLIINYSITT